MRTNFFRWVMTLVLGGLLLACEGEPDVDAPTTQTIGPEGGRIESADGRLTVEVPAGAFSEKTKVTIEPVDNDATRGLGRAYRLGPEGTTFAQPVKVSFHYTDSELNGAGSGGLGIAFKTGSAQWSAPTDRVVDANARTVSVRTTHFSTWSLFEMFVLQPSSANVRVNGTKQLEALSCVVETDPETLITALVPTCQPLSSESFLSNWSVNGTSGGGAEAGTVTAQGATATYRAPSQVPAQNPVSVSVEVSLGKAKGLLVSNLRIESDCPVPFCRFSGTSRQSDLVGDELLVIGTAEVTWEFSELQGTEAVYLPSGTANVQWDHTACEISLSPSTFTIAPTDGELKIDFTTSPPTYRGSGGSNDDNGIQTWTCPNSDPFEEYGVGADWFYGSGTLTPEGKIEGSASTETAEDTWSFTAQ